MQLTAKELVLEGAWERLTGVQVEKVLKKLFGGHVTFRSFEVRPGIVWVQGVVAEKLRVSGDIEATAKNKDPEEITLTIEAHGTVSPPKAHEAKGAVITSEGNVDV